MGTRNMTDLDPCLAGCDAALAEAELLLAMLNDAALIDAELGPVRRSITTLRREVDRLRGMKVVPSRRETDPFWMKLGSADSPWPASGSDRGERA